MNLWIEGLWLFCRKSNPLELVRNSIICRAFVCKLWILIPDSFAISACINLGINYRNSKTRKSWCFCWSLMPYLCHCELGGVPIERALFESFISILLLSVRPYLRIILNLQRIVIINIPRKREREKYAFVILHLAVCRFQCYYLCLNYNSIWATNYFKFIYI